MRKARGEIVAARPTRTSADRDLIALWHRRLGDNTPPEGARRADVDLGALDLEPWRTSIAELHAVDYGRDFRFGEVGASLEQIVGTCWAGLNLSALERPERTDIRRLLLQARLVRQPVAMNVVWVLDRHVASRMICCRLLALPVGDDPFRVSRLVLALFRRPFPGW